MRGATLGYDDTGYDLPVSIHAPHAGRDMDYLSPELLRILFQSTRPMRGATDAVQDARRDAVFQSTRPMRGATRCSADLSRG